VLTGAERVLREHKPKIWLSGHPEFMLQQWDESLYNLRQWRKQTKTYDYIIDAQGLIKSAILAISKWGNKNIANFIRS
jgi:ADP-heptose:LPS heptosyltransferase